MKFSIIIPVYNQEAYVGQCLDSILSQEFSDFEIITVDDGSTDGSAAVCRAYAEKDGRIKLLSEKNSGPSVARNTGTAEASGEYLIFVDGDDLLYPGALKRAAEAIDASGAPDIVVCRIDRFSRDPQNTVLLDGTDGLKPRGTGDELAEYVNKKGNEYSISPCRYAINREFYFIKGLSFKPALKQEDELFTPLLIAAAESYGVCEGKCYLYRKHKGSRNNTPTALNKLSFLKIAEELLDSKDITQCKAKCSMLDYRGKFMFHRGLMEHNEVIKDKTNDLVSAATLVYKKHPDVADELNSLRRLIKLIGTSRGIRAFIKLNKLVASTESYVDPITETDTQSLESIAKKTVTLRKSKQFRRKVNRIRFKREVLFGNAASRRDYSTFLLNKLGIIKRSDFLPLSDFDPTNGEETSVAMALIANYAAKKKSRQVLIFSRLQYYTSGGGQRGAQLAKTFSKMGFDVLFLYSESNYYTFDKDFIDELSLHLPISYFDTDTLVSLISSGALAIFEHPDARFLPFLKALKQNGATVVYEQIDNWDSELGAGWYSRTDYLEFLKNADILLGTANNLCEMAEKDAGRNVEYCPNAVDTGLFDWSKKYETPHDLHKGEKTLLYYGHLSGNWLDWPLLFKTAELCPRCKFNVIGYGSLDPIKKKPANVYFIGSRHQSELPAYLAASDFGLLHFNTLEVGSYVSPIKVFEYLAMHKRVLAAPLPDIDGYPNVICSSDPNVWASAIMDPPPEQPYDDFVSSNSWEARCRHILKEVDRLEQ